MTAPAIRLNPRMHIRALSGHPWIYSNEIGMDADIRSLPAGSIVRFQSAEGRALGTGYFNPHTLIAGRVLARDPDQKIDAAFFRDRFSAALALRARLFDRPFYRLIHAEADGLPGLIVDRFGGVVVVQANTAGMDALIDPVVAALQETVKPDCIVLRLDTPARQTEGLSQEVRVVHGKIDGPSALEENGATFFADLAGGQKTGWFYDHRDNRAFVSKFAKGGKVLDLYAFAGAFGVQCAVAGAREVVAIDRSEPALALARQAAEANGVTPIMDIRRAEAFDAMESMAQGGRKFDVVVADPPAFVKSKKDLKPGLKGYRKMVKLAVPLVRPGGVLLVASCSHNVSPEAFAEEVARGLVDGRRSGRILRSAGAGPDHPVHPLLPESAYLKAMVLQLD
ncbi:class I SAM-dependent rRNA methyltransferase [Emcibacter sp. SYSU 3D8]|uniref:class I SAM-dependent rRNA methyltransferase n=1 Tax=Emcibacter sp. SYSU 3D8 TaxID=3133969 RepID=UPI0031FF40C9